MQAQIPNGEITDAAGTLVSKFSGRIEHERSRDTDVGYGVADNLRLIAAGIDDRGRGLQIRWTEPLAEEGAAGESFVRPIRVRELSIRTRTVWFDVLEAIA